MTFSPNRISVVAAHVLTMEPVKLDSLAKDIVASVTLDSQEQTVNNNNNNNNSNNNNNNYNNNDNYNNIALMNQRCF